MFEIRGSSALATKALREETSPARALAALHSKAPHKKSWRAGPAADRCRRPAVGLPAFCRALILPRGRLKFLSPPTVPVRRMDRAPSGAGDGERLAGCRRRGHVLSVRARFRAARRSRSAIRYAAFTLFAHPGAEVGVIRPTIPADRSAILALIEASGQFDAEGLTHVRITLEAHLAGHADAIWLTADDGEPVGVAYCLPEPVTSGTWNLLMLWTRGDRHHQGHGTALVRRVEEEIRTRAARLLIVETSGLPAYAPARAFYAKCGFAHEATIRNFFADGDHKLVFTRSLGSSAA